MSIEEQKNWDKADQKKLVGLSMTVIIFSQTSNA